MSNGPIIELAPITLRPDVDATSLIAASERLEREFLVQQPGYLGRALTHAGGGRWMDVVFWADQAAAEAVIARIPGSEACAAYFACMEGADSNDAAAGVTHLQTVRRFGIFADR